MFVIYVHYIVPYYYLPFQKYEIFNSSYIIIAINFLLIIGAFIDIIIYTMIYECKITVYTFSHVHEAVSELPFVKRQVIHSHSFILPVKNNF